MLTRTERFVVAAIRHADNADRLANLVAAVHPLMSGIEFYMGRNARTSVSFESVMEVERLRLALRRGERKKCHRCDDTGIDNEWRDGITRPCPLRKMPGHERVPMPAPVIAYMVAQRDNARERSLVGPGHSVSPYDAELAIMGL